MKISHLRLSIAILAISLISCSKENKEDNNDHSTIPNEVSVEIDGNAWTGNIGSVATSGGTRQINSENGNDNTSIQIFFPEDTTGTFDLAISNEITISYAEGNVMWNDNISGTFKLTKNQSEEISGSFSTVLISAFNSDTLTLTNGAFSWKF
ncbi:MAG: DUF6252 family protein [Owenweeksia sp.]|nr:DUF6252 family protein [Owenweeksia sp.]